MTIPKFQKIIWEYYRANKRSFPWRRTRDPYKILVSEIMLQQTQALRVVPRYISFLKKFPTTKVLASAPLADVLREWQGLGYNRRAIFLKKCAETIERDFAGKFPKDFKTICTLPGIGPATAGDLMIFAWNMPVPVIETNVRSVFIHFFFSEKAAQKIVDPNKKVTDKEILPLVERSMDHENPREWYAALFDYGVYLKKTLPNPSRKSAHHVRQTKFAGSLRQKRATILRLILEKARTEKEIQNATQYESEIISEVLAGLLKEGFISQEKTKGKKGKSGLFVPA